MPKKGGRGGSPKKGGGGGGGGGGGEFFVRRVSWTFPGFTPIYPWTPPKKGYPPYTKGVKKWHFCTHAKRGVFGPFLGFFGVPRGSIKCLKNSLIF